MKKRKLNSKNPKYMDKNQLDGSLIKERKLTVVCVRVLIIFGTKTYFQKKK